MKKFMKSLSLICLAVLMVCPLMFAGCARNYTINVEKVGNGQINYHVVDGESALGENAVKAGSKFEVAIKPDAGYEIATIEIDGVEYSEAYDKDYHEVSFDKVKANHTLKVTFEAKNMMIVFQCLEDGNTGNYVTYNQTLNKGTFVLVNGCTTVKYGQSLDLATNMAYGTEAGEIEWKLLITQEGHPEYGTLMALDDVIDVQGDYVIRVDMTKAEIDAILVP